MKWIKLDGKKEPVFKQEYLLWFPEVDKGESVNWSSGQLKSIEHTESGKEYLFLNDENQVLSGASHYAIVEPPKEVEHKTPPKAGL